jgi:hypothetical protein
MVFTYQADVQEVPLGMTQNGQLGIFKIVKFIAVVSKLTQPAPDPCQHYKSKVSRDFKNEIYLPYLLMQSGLSEQLQLLQPASLDMKHHKGHGEGYWENRTSEDVLRFSYSTVVEIRWMQNFWLCEDDTDFSTCGGYIQKVAEYMGQRLNMTVELQSASEDGLGSYNAARGTWTPGITRDVRQ